MEEKKEMPDNSEKNILKYFLLEFGLANVWIGMTGDVLFTGYLIYLGASDFLIGVISSIPLIMNIFAPLFSYIIDRSVKRRELTLRTSLPARALTIVYAIIPMLFFYKATGSPLILFIITYTVMIALMNFGSISWFAWMGDLIPEDKRGYFFSRRAFVGSFIATIFSLIGGKILDFFALNKHLGFFTNYTVSTVFAIISFYFFAKLPEARNAVCISGGFSFKDMFKRIFAVGKNRNFLRLVIFNASWSFGTLFTSVYMNIFLIKVLKLDYTTIMLFIASNSVVNLAFYQFWGKMIDKYGCKPVLFICGAFLGITPLFWIFTVYSTWILLLIYTFAGIFWSGIGIAQLNIGMKLCPPDERATYFAFNTMIVSVASFIAPICGGFVINTIGDYALDIKFMRLNAYQILFFIGAFGRFLPNLLLMGIKEPKEEKVEKVFTVFISTMGVGFIEGMGNIMSFVLAPFNAIKHYITHDHDEKS